MLPVHRAIDGVWAVVSCSLRVEGFIPDDGVISDLGECLTKLDGLLFQIFYKYIIILKSCTKLKTDVLLEVCLIKNLEQH